MSVPNNVQHGPESPVLGLVRTLRTPPVIGEMIMAENATQRPLREIAAEIEADWASPYFGAWPYLQAMEELDKVTDAYYADSAASVVRYFLANANTWRGETARRVKAELKLMVKGVY